MMFHIYCVSNKWLEIKKKLCISQLISLSQFIFCAEKVTGPPLVLKLAIFLVTGKMVADCIVFSKRQKCGDNGFMVPMT